MLLLFLQCNNTLNDPVKPVDPVDYDTLIPLKAENFWIYKKYSLNSDGTVYSSYKFNSGFIVKNFKSNRDVYNFYRCDTTLRPIIDTAYLEYGGSKLVFQNSEGFHYSGIKRGDSIINTFDDLIFPYPATKGNIVSGRLFFYSSLGNSLNVPDERTTDYTCLSTDTLFVTPLGEFNCIAVKMVYYDFEPIFRDEVIYFIKPGLGIVGMVQMVYHYSKDQYSYAGKEILVNYQLN